MARQSSLCPFFTSLGSFSVQCLIQTILLLALLTTSLVQTYGQNADPSTGFGAFPYQTYLGESENINLGTGNVNVQIPLLKLPGRDGHDFELHLSYNSEIWYVHTYTPPQGQTINQYANFPGWNLSLPQLQYDQYVPLGSATTCTENYRVTMWDGRTIHFPYLFTSCYPSNGGGNEQTQYENFISSSDGCSADFAVLETSSSVPKLHLRNGETLWFGSNNFLWNGQRVEKCTPQGTTAGTCASGATGTLYWRGLGSETLHESDLAGTVQNDYVFFNGQRVARSDSAGLIHYYFSDHLGTHGVVESATGTTCEQDIDYYPYGGVEHDYCPNVAQNYKFTGKERDTESGLDNFDKRYHGSSLGRFMTPDPIGIMKQKLRDPQQWNMYSYARNNPLRFTDPTGQYVCQGNKDQCAQVKAGYDAAKKALAAANPKSEQAKQLKSVLGFLGEPGKANGVAVTFGRLDTGTPAQPSTQTTTDLLGTKHTTTTVTFDLEQLNPNVRLTSRHPLEPLGNDTGGVLVHEGTHGRDDLAQGHNPQSKEEALTTERNAYRNEGYVYDSLGVPSYANPSLTAPGANRDQAIEKLANASVDAEGW